MGRLVPLPPWAKRKEIEARLNYYRWLHRGLVLAYAATVLASLFILWLSL